MADLTGPNPDEINGLDAHDAPVTAKPVLIGGAASSTAPTSVDEGDVVNAWFDLHGAQQVGVGPGWVRTAGPATLDADDETLEVDTTGADYVVFRTDAATSAFFNVAFDGSTNAGATWTLGLTDVADMTFDTGAPVLYLDSSFSNPDTGRSWLVKVFGQNRIRIRVLSYASGSASFSAYAGTGSTIVPSKTETWLRVNATDLQRSGGIDVGSNRAAQMVAIVDSGGAQLFADGVVVVTGDTISGDPDSGTPPVKIGGVAATSTPSSAAPGDRVDAWFGPNGQIRVGPVFEDAGTIWPVSTANPFPVGLFDYSTGATIHGDGTNGLDVDVTRVPSDPFGANADAASATGSISAKLRFIAATGIPITGTVTVASHAVTNAGTFAVQDSQVIADNGGFTDGTSKLFVGGYIYDDVAGTALTENDAAAARIDSKRAQVHVVEDGATRGRYATVSASNALKVDGSAVTQPVSIAAAVPVTDNAASLTVDAPVGTPVFTRLSDGSAALIGQKAMAASLPVALASDQSTLPVSLASVPSHAVTNAGTFAVQAAGDVANDAVDSGSPVKIGGKANSAAPTAVSSGDRVDGWFSTRGAQFVEIASASVTAVITNALGDAQAANNALYVASYPVLYNGTTYDRQRGNTTGAAHIGGQAHDAAWAAANQPLVVGAFASAATPSAISADGDVVHLWAGTRGQLAVMMVDASGSAVSPGGGTQYAQDAAMGTPTGTVAIGRSSTVVPTSVSANGDAVSLWATPAGALNVTLRDDAGNITGISGFPVFVNIAQVDTPVLTVGNIGHDGVDSGAPVKIGGRADSSPPTAVAAGDRVNAWYNLLGAAYVSLAVGGNDSADGNTNTNTQISLLNSGLSSGFNAASHLGVRSFLFNGSTWDRPRSVAALSAAPNVTTGIQAVGVGPGWDAKTDPAGVAATSTANAVTVVVDGADMIALQVTAIGTTPGSMIIETTNDDTNWVTAGMVVKVSTGPDLRIEGAFVPAVNDVYLVRTTGVRQVRYRVNAVYASGTATVKVTRTAGPALVKAIDLPGAPHNIGYALASATAQYTSAQTSTTLGPTVASTQRMVVTSIQIGVGGTTAGTLQVYFGTGAYSRGTNKAIFDHEFAPSATSKPGFYASPAVPWMGAADEEVRVTGVGAINPLTITIWYYLIAA